MLPGTPKGSYPGGGRGGQWGAVPLLLPLQTDYKPGSCLFTALTIGLQWDYKRAVLLPTSYIYMCIALHLPEIPT